MYGAMTNSDLMHSVTNNINSYYQKKFITIVDENFRLPRDGCDFVIRRRIAGERRELELDVNDRARRERRGDEEKRERELFHASVLAQFRA